MMLAMMAPVGKSVGAENRREKKHNKLNKNGIEFKCPFRKGMLALLARLFITTKIKPRMKESCPQRQQMVLIFVTCLSKVAYELLTSPTLLPTVGNKRQQVRG